MKRFKRWLIERFLPAWCREELLEENRRLAETIAEKNAEIRRLNAYIDGVQAALRASRRITIQNGGGSR